jgi:hypothetical protein
VISEREVITDSELVGEAEILGENLPKHHFVYQKSHITLLEMNSYRRGCKPANNRLSCEETSKLSNPA